MPLIPDDWIKENPEPVYGIRNHPVRVAESAKSTREEIAACFGLGLRSIRRGRL